MTPGLWMLAWAWGWTLALVLWAVEPPPLGGHIE